ncbi:hypothetical protein BDD43_0171 [Mucilaginibacter gracilis]|uniref:Uncharacterized protein n=1 Tax=Mucilaginibacter gracilis TaxID=423350 RepID=A0A495IVR3_9SPHI|nr:hypothetical protein [Mucilaginibacter gracilis]RKR80078.1 hypothetical protein BDD43_0171 [Mucilaginibacter gracilis]
MSVWIFELLSPTSNYIHNLATSMPSTDILIAEDNYDDYSALQYIFGSIHLNHISDSTEAYNKALQLKLLVDGASFLVYEDKQAYRPIKLGRIREGDGYFFTVADQITPTRFDVDFSINPVVEKESQSTVAKLIQLARQNEFVLNILLILSQGMDFRNLYQALDECKSFLKGKRKIENIGIDNAKLNRFTHTANNFATIGLLSRHGTLAQQPPANPLSLSESQELITDLIRIILRDYFDLKEFQMEKIILAGNLDDLF